jgi:ABC-type uncharacterized transport system substrate-binding protein
MPDTFITVNRRRIIALAARERLPVVYPNGATVRQGGLIGYGVDNVESVHGAATYVNRILPGGEAGRSPGSDSDQVRAGDQPENREGTQPRRAAHAARPRRRGD